MTTYSTDQQSKEQRPAISSAGRDQPAAVLPWVSCLLQSMPCCPLNGTWCFKWIKLFICHMLFSGLQLKGLICLSTKKKKKLCGRGGGGHVFEFSAFFLWVRSPHSRKKKKKKNNPHICYTNTTCGTKNKTHTDESRRVARYNFRLNFKTVETASLKFKNHNLASPPPRPNPPSKYLTPLCD